MVPPNPDLPEFVKRDGFWILTPSQAADIVGRTVEYPQLCGAALATQRAACLDWGTAWTEREYARGVQAAAEENDSRYSLREALLYVGLPSAAVGAIVTGVIIAVSVVQGK